MARRTETFRSRLLEIVDDSIQFQHYFSLIKLLETRKEESEGQLKTLKKELSECKEDQKKKELAKRMAIAYRRWYGLSKEKIEVCLQFQDLIQQLTIQLQELNNEQAIGGKDRRVAKSEEKTESECRPERGKAKLKQTKLAGVTDKSQPKKQISEDNGVTTLEWEESSKEALDLCKPRKYKKE